MSKYVKDLVTKELAQRLSGVEDALLVNVVGLDANRTVQLRKHLRDKQMNLLVVKNNLARRACEGTPLSAAFDGAAGTLAMLWGGEDLISLAKEVIEIQRSGQFAPFEPRGGVMDGEHLSAEMVKDISKWPNREGQLSLLMGQVLSPGAKLCSQLLAPGSALASQIEKKSEGVEEEAIQADGE
ncbi:MAG: 50S ribosomal protein L10 [Planctomycetaceae bacterium]|nr:MAG: 50S ribosomal protein L10 [Planctomycetaceae bacterium]